MSSPAERLFAPAITNINERDPNGIRTHFRDFVMLRNFATNMR